MKSPRCVFIGSAILFLLLSSSIVTAGDFDWVKDFNIRAEGNLSDFKARLGARFNIGGVEVNAVLSNVKTPADAYMVCALGEMSRQRTDYVIERYQSHKGKGWGALAKSLGIKPGSKEFHALKQGDDLYAGGSSNGKENGKGKEKGKGKKKNKG